MPSPVVLFPCGSTSTSSVFFSATASEAPRLTAVVVFPTPPFWLAIAMILAIKTQVKLTCYNIYPNYLYHKKMTKERKIFGLHRQLPLTRATFGCFCRAREDGIA